MKISKLFHWLYASIMFLPLLVAPIFAIYSHRHTIDSYSVTRDKYQVVYFNQGVENNYINNELETFGPYGLFYNSQLYPSGHKIFLKLGLSGDVQTFHINYSNGSSNYDSYESTDLNNISFIKTLSQDTIYSMFAFPYENGQRIYTHNFNIYDLTQMFGEGNEPTIQEFNEMFPNDYYEYTTSKKVLVQNGTETLNNTDIGSQFVYAIYNPLNDYFNFNKFLGIGNLYDWMQLNLFKGTAPLGFFIFWELLMYWLLISLIWLIFDVAMYVPKIAHRWLDKARLE